MNSEKSSDFVVAPELTKKGWSSRADVAEIDKFIFKFIFKFKRPRMAQTILKQNEVGGFTFPDIKIDSQTTVIKKV